MTDPTEAALRAIESKYYPLVIEGKALMPFYPREDVRLMVEAAVAAECARCARLVDRAAAECKSFHASDVVINLADTIRNPVN